MEDVAQAYDALARVYDRFTADHDYEAWTASLEELARGHGLRGRRLLDLGCGTGKSLLPFARRGYRATGCDVSAAMLAEARDKAGDDVRLLRSDIRSLPAVGEFDLVTCLDDAVNYMLDDADLTAAFRSAARSLAPAGVFVFDLNTLGVYRSLFTRDTCSGEDDCFFALRGEADAAMPGGAVAPATIEAFWREGGQWRRATSHHRQRHHTHAAVLAALATAGLDCAAVHGLTADGSLHAEFDELAHTKRVYVARLQLPGTRKEVSDAEDREAGRADRPRRGVHQGQLTQRQAAGSAGCAPTFSRRPARPRLKPTIDVFTASDGRVHLFRGGEGDFAIEPDGRPIVALLSLLDGTGDLAALERRAAADGLELTAGELGAMIGQLWELGAVEDAADDDRLGRRQVGRYDRQLRYFGDVAPPRVARGDYQRRLAEARVVVLGLGGLGGWAAYALACAGVGTIVGVDGDAVEWSNLNRQILYREADIGQGKAAAAARSIREFNSGIRFEPVARMLESRADVEAVVAGASFVVDAADRPAHEIERWVNAACFACGVPYLMMSQFPPLARLGPTYVPGLTGCYACQEAAWRELYPLFDELVDHRRRQPSPAASFGPACGLIGSQVAMDVVHHLSGVCRPATLGAALTVDLRTMAVERTQVEAVPDCEVCGALRRSHISSTPSVL